MRHDRAGMARSAQVLVSKRHPVRFPDRCPVCGKASPGHAATLEQVFGTLLMPVGRSVRARWDQTMPVCKQHQRRIHNGRLADVLSWLGLTIASLAALMYLADHYEMFASGWWSWAGVLVLGLALPRGLIALTARPLFDASSDDDQVVFEMRNADYARDFIGLNRT